MIRDFISKESWASTNRKEVGMLVRVRINGSSRSKIFKRKKKAEEYAFRYPEWKMELVRKNGK